MSADPLDARLRADAVRGGCKGDRGAAHYIRSLRHAPIRIYSIYTNRGLTRALYIMIRCRPIR